MRLLPSWLREFVNIPVDDTKLADDLAMAGISVEGVISEGGETVYDIDITPNRVDAMNHYGVARDCAAVYNSDVKPSAIDLPRPRGPDVRDSPAFTRYEAELRQYIEETSNDAGH